MRRLCELVAKSNMYDWVEYAVSVFDPSNRFMHVEVLDSR